MKKKILITMHSMPIGGAERILCDILQRFDYNIYDVTLLLYNKTGELLESVPQQVTIKSLYGPPCYSFINKVKEKFYAIINLRRVIDRMRVFKKVDNHYDSIISFCHGHAHMMHNFIIDRTDNNISWIHSDLSVGNWGLPFFGNNIKNQEAAYNRMNNIVYVSNDAKNAFHKVFKLSPSVKEDVIYNFVNHENILRLSNEKICDIDKRKFTFINVGRLIDAKNQDRIIIACDKLRTKGYDFECWIIGDGYKRNYLQQCIDDKHLNEVVKLLGGKQNPYKYIDKADCFVLSSHQEGFSIVIVEAFTLSKPVISMKSSGPAELLGDSKYGLLVNQDIDELVNAMERIMRDKELYNHYSKMACVRASDFDGKNSMTEILHLLN